MRNCAGIGGHASTWHCHGLPVTPSLSGVRVSAVGGRASRDDQTDAKGEFNLPLVKGVQPGQRIVLRVQKDGYEPRSEGVAASEEVILQIVLSPIGRHAQNAPDQRAVDGHSRDDEENRRKGAPVERLAELGWSITPEGTDRWRFSALGIFPRMDKSSVYFRSLKAPFSINLSQPKTIDGLAHLQGIPNFTGLSISAGEFHDISELKSLTSLATLEITQTPINDLSPVAGLKNLRELMLNEDPVSDIGPLSNLHQLTRLGLMDTRVSDLSPLRGLPLEWLTLDGSNVVNLSPIAEMETLDHLDISGKQVADLARLKHLTNLRRINITDQVPLDLSPLGDLPQVESLLILGGASPSDIAPLGKMQGLSELAIIGDFLHISPVRNFATIEQLPNLSKLYLNLVYIQMDDVIHIGRLQNLRELGLPCPPNISNISAIGQLKKLEVLVLSGASIVDISPLLDLPRLRELSIRGVPARADVLTELERRGVKVTR